MLPEGNAGQISLDVELSRRTRNLIVTDRLGVTETKLAITVAAPTAQTTVPKNRTTVLFATGRCRHRAAEFDRRQPIGDLTRVIAKGRNLGTPGLTQASEGVAPPTAQLTRAILDTQATDIADDEARKTSDLDSRQLVGGFVSLVPEGISMTVTEITIAIATPTAEPGRRESSSCGPTGRHGAENHTGSA